MFKSNLCIHIFNTHEQKTTCNDVPFSCVNLDLPHPEINGSSFHLFFSFFLQPFPTYFKPFVVLFWIPSAQNPMCSFLLRQPKNNPCSPCNVTTSNKVSLKSHEISSYSPLKLWLSLFFLPLARNSTPSPDFSRIRTVRPATHRSRSPKNPAVRPGSWGFHEDFPR